MHQREEYKHVCSAWIEIFKTNHHQLWGSRWKLLLASLPESNISSRGMVMRSCTSTERKMMVRGACWAARVSDVLFLWQWTEMFADKCHSLLLWTDREGSERQVSPLPRVRRTSQCCGKIKTQRPVFKSHHITLINLLNLLKSYTRLSFPLGDEYSTIVAICHLLRVIARWGIRDPSAAHSLWN